MTQPVDKAVTKYQTTHSNKISRLIYQDLLAGSQLDSTCWQHVVVIPSHSEDQQVQPQMASLASAAQHSKSCESRVLVIYVINETKSASKPIQTSNEACSLFIQDSCRTVKTITGTHYLLHFCRSHHQYEYLDFLILNFTKDYAFNDDQGVGLARRIGCDLAFLLWTSQHIQSSFFYSTDADTIIPEDYFETPQTNKAVSAYTFPFKHVSLQPDDHDVAAFDLEAMQLYDLFLRYYKQGLHSAGSPYAFFTIGSILAIDMTRYAQVRGFPLRLAGEDFYLLNKLAKLAPIKELPTQPLLINYRPSQRVPFGTGPAVSRIAEQLSTKEPYLVYHPMSFNILKQVIKSFEKLSSEKTVDAFFFYLQEGLQQASIQPGLTAQICNYFRSKYFEELFSRALQKKSSADIQKVIHENFDAFKTLKFIHFIREHLGTVPFTVDLIPSHS